MKQRAGDPHMSKAFHVLPSLGAALLLAACGKSSGPAQGAPSAPEVGVITLAPRTVSLSTELPGRTSAYRIAEVRP